MSDSNVLFNISSKGMCLSGGGGVVLRVCVICEGFANGYLGECIWRMCFDFSRWGGGRIFFFICACVQCAWGVCVS